jgi:hypothetical protein
MDLHQGDCIRLGPNIESNLQPDLGPNADRQLYQVISIDDRADRCWLRPWPLVRQGSPVFEISLRQVTSAQKHRPYPGGGRS